jgi:hypothetical protein
MPIPTLSSPNTNPWIWIPTTAGRSFDRTKTRVLVLSSLATPFNFAHLLHGISPVRGGGGENTAVRTFVREDNYERVEIDTSYQWVVQKAPNEVGEGVVRYGDTVYLKNGTWGFLQAGRPLTVEDGGLNGNTGVATTSNPSAWIFRKFLDEYRDPNDATASRGKHSLPAGKYRLKLVRTSLHGNKRFDSYYRYSNDYVGVFGNAIMASHERPTDAAIWELLPRFSSNDNDLYDIRLPGSDKAFAFASYTNQTCVLRTGSYSWKLERVESNVYRLVCRDDSSPKTNGWVLVQKDYNLTQRQFYVRPTDHGEFEDRYDDRIVTATIAFEPVGHDGETPRSLLAPADYRALQHHWHQRIVELQPKSRDTHVVSPSQGKLQLAGIRSGEFQEPLDSFCRFFPLEDGNVVVAFADGTVLSASSPQDVEATRFHRDHMTHGDQFQAWTLEYQDWGLALLKNSRYQTWLAMDATGVKLVEQKDRAETWRIRDIPDAVARWQSVRDSDGYEYWEKRMSGVYGDLTCFDNKAQANGQATAEIISEVQFIPFLMISDPVMRENKGGKDQMNHRKMWSESPYYLKKVTERYITKPDLVYPASDAERQETFSWTSSWNTGASKSFSVAIGITVGVEGEGGFMPFGIGGKAKVSASVSTTFTAAWEYSQSFSEGSSRSTTYTIPGNMKATLWILTTELDIVRGFNGGSILPQPLVISAGDISAPTGSSAVLKLKR